MSTEYTLLERTDGKTSETIELWEHSNLLDFVMTRGGTSELDMGEIVGHMRNLTPEQVVIIGLAALKTASYWMDPDDFDKAVAREGRDLYVKGLIQSMMRAPDAS